MSGVDEAAVVHLFGFVGNAASETKASIHTGGVAEAANGVMGKVEALGYEPVVKSVTRTLDGWLVAVHYEVPNRPEHADKPMWHVFRRADEPWPTLTPATPTDHQSQPAGGGSEET